MEARSEFGLNTVDAIVGRIQRYPPIYYERRIELSLPKLKGDGAMAAYDDIAASYDRLGKSQEAITWMRRKRDFMKANPRLVDDSVRYKTEANEGTFWAHKWFSEGAKKDDLTDIKTGREMIAKAIAINPDAHFGREHVQLGVMDWAIYLANTKDERKHGLLYFLKTDTRERAEVTLRGLVGLMVLGNAWESVDILAAIGSIDGSATSITDLANLRIDELMAQGKRSLSGDTVGAETFASAHDDIVENTKKNFVVLRKDADAYRRHYEDFINGQVRAGKHPNKDNSEFWRGYVEPKRPRITSEGVISDVDREYGSTALARGSLPMFLAVMLGASAVFSAIGWLFVTRVLRISR